MLSRKLRIKNGEKCSNSTREEGIVIPQLQWIQLELKKQMAKHFRQKNLRSPHKNKNPFSKILEKHCSVLKILDFSHDLIQKFTLHSDSFFFRTARQIINYSGLIEDAFI